MSQPDEATVRRVLRKNDRGLKLKGALLDAWEACGRQYAGLAWWRRKSTRAAVMWEHSAQNAISYLGDDPEVKTVRHYDTLSLIIEDLILLRVKKVSIELRSSNVQTVLASLFHAHQNDLFGYPGLQRVEAGYMLSRLETEVAWTGIVARERKRRLFHFPFDDLGEGAAPAIFPPQPKRTPAQLATVKKQAEEPKENKEG